MVTIFLLFLEIPPRGYEDYTGIKMGQKFLVPGRNKHEKDSKRYHRRQCLHIIRILKSTGL